MSESKPEPRHDSLAAVVTEKQPMLHPQDSVQAAGEKMRDLGAETLPVSEGTCLVGTVDQKNPDRRAAGFGHDPNDATVSEIMSDDAAYCLETDDCAAALRKMNERSLDRLPVVDRDMHIVGVVTQEDLTQRLPSDRVR